jgi:hypothetical protein
LRTTAGALPILAMLHGSATLPWSFLALHIGERFLLRNQPIPHTIDKTNHPIEK